MSFDYRGTSTWRVLNDAYAGSCVVSATMCISCLPGKYRGSMGCTSTLCSVGTYGIVGALSVQEASCIDCAAGTYQGTAGTAACIDCAAGTYQGTAGSASCIDCAVGTHSPTGSRRCYRLRRHASEGYAPCSTGISACDSEATLLVCDPGTSLVPDSTALYYHEETTTAQAACCLPPCDTIPVIDPETRCTCAGNEFRTDETDDNSDPFAGTTCSACVEGQSAVMFGTACVGCPPGRFLMASGACVDCPFPLRCEGGDQCAEGAIGIACSTCGVETTTDDAPKSWEEQLLGLQQDTVQYYNSYGTCTECPTEDALVPVVVVSVLTGVWMLVMFKLTAVKDDIDNEMTQGAIKVLGSTATIAFGHLQIAVHILTLPSVQWPQLLVDIMQFLRHIAFLSFTDFVRPECQVPGGMDPELEFLMKYALKQLLFAVLFGAFLTVYILGKMRAGTTGGLGTQYHGMNAMVALYSVFFLLLIRSNFAIWDCTWQEAKLEGCTDGTSMTKEDCPCGETWTDAAPETHVLDESPEIECFGNGEGTKRNVWLGVATFSAISTIAYVVILPVFFLRKLSSAKEEGALTGYAIRAQYGWLFTRYKYKVCTYYEFLFMARKSIVVLLGMFISSVGRRRLMLTLTTTVIASALLLNCYLRPYSDHDLVHADTLSSERSWSSMDVLDAVGLVCNLVSLACAVYFVGECHTPSPGADEMCIKREEGNTSTIVVSFIALGSALGPIGLSIWFLRHNKNNAQDKK